MIRRIPANLSPTFHFPVQSRWLESYADFDRSLWATHSVARPWELARQYPNEITVLDKKAFFWP